MGHLFAAGGQTVDGDGVRELYIGSLAQVRTDVFPESIDYLALGHLHVPQRVGGSDYIRYSVLPYPSVLGRRSRKKASSSWSFRGTNQRQEYSRTQVPGVEDPTRRLANHCGGIDDLKCKGSNAWLEISI